MGVSLLGVGVGVAGAATVVSCPTANLQTAINAAAPGTTLVVHGTCTGNFTIDEKTRT
jgi:nitrous oxidase accessory protein NosD